MVVTSAPTTSFAPYCVIASNAGPCRSMSSSMPSTISVMLDFDLRHAARRECRHQQPAQPGVLLAVHLGDELEAHELVVLLVARPLRHLRGEPFGVGEHLVDVGVAPDDDLRRAVAEHIERRLPRPARH